MTGTRNESKCDEISSLNDSFFTSSRKRQLVSAQTGEPTELKGEALERAIDDQIVVTRNAYELQQQQYPESNGQPHTNNSRRVSAVVR